MNNYYPYGYSPYPGQPPAQPYSYPTAPPYPAQTYPPPANHAFDAHAQVRDSYEQNQPMIPGLGYGHPSHGYSWQQAPQAPPAPPPPVQQPWPSREEPNLIPASQYYQQEISVNAPPKAVAPKPSGVVSQAASRQPTKQPANDAEEGELSEGEFDDLYEPAETVMDTSPRQSGGNAQAAAMAGGRYGNADAASAAVGWYGGPRDGGAQSPAAPDAAARDRSGSYSPYLSPREVEPRTAYHSQHNTPQQTQTPNGHATQPSAPGAAQPGSSALVDARKKAQAAILNLWPLDVRYQQYIDEGIDEGVIKDLFADLGLDISSTGQSTIPEGSTSSQLPGTSQTLAQSSAKTPSAQAPMPLAKPPAQDQAPPSSAKSAGEERKDRIARLLAAKGAKPGASTANAGSQVDPKSSGQATGTSSKEMVQQQKMDALQKSREARAQKAAERKGSLQASQSQETSPTSVAQRPPSATGTLSGSSVRPQMPQEAAPPPAAASASSIPGLFLSAPQPAPVNNQRKRPVAADFVSASSQPNKRAFDQNRQDKPFVIDVSDASDDEDVEMEIGSPTDESTNIQRTDSPSQKTASFRDFPPLSDGRPQLSPAPSNVATPQSGFIVTQPKQAHLEVINRQIEAMKRQIALRVARKKLQAAINGRSSSPKSNGQPPDAAVDSDETKPGIRRVQSMGASSASDQPNGRSSPVIAEASSSMRLPKPSDQRAGGESNRAEKRRMVSTNLPAVESRLQTKKSKLKLLMFQVARLQKEIEEDDAEKQRLAQEMEELNQDSDNESSEPRSQLKSNSVGPVVTQTTTGPQVETQTPMPAVEATALVSNADDAATSAPSSADAPGPSRYPDTQNEEDASIAVQEVDSAVTGKAATSPHDAPDSAENAAAPHLEAPVNQVTNDDEVEESQSGTSDGPSDVVMDESDDSDSQGGEGESSDAYEPPEAAVPADATQSPSISPVPAESTVSLANSDADLQQPSSRASPIPEQISLGLNESTPEQCVDAVREAPCAAKATDEMPSGDIFIPYESPLQHFRAYRFHPKFAETVAGGLQSLTYSNRIDPNLPVCPDQLADRECPRGADCIYQHFESMKLPDDQILLQLGATTLEGEERTRFNSGLRELLQEMRSRNIKDFPSIAQSIVDYHNRFTGDPSKILPLGNVSI